MAFFYLGYLAFDVFRRVVALPITLATRAARHREHRVDAAPIPEARGPRGRDGTAGRKTLPGGALAVLGHS
jgi:hypothetical protein